MHIGFLSTKMSKLDLSTFSRTPELKYRFLLSVPQPPRASSPAKARRRHSTDVLASVPEKWYWGVTLPPAPFINCWPEFEAIVLISATNRVSLFGANWRSTLSLLTSPQPHHNFTPTHSKPLRSVTVSHSFISCTSHCSLSMGELEQDLRSVVKSYQQTSTIYCVSETVLLSIFNISMRLY